MAAREPYRWFTEARVTYALKVLGLIVLAAVIIVNILHFLARIQTIAVILIGAIFVAYLIYPAVRALNRRMSLTAAILTVYASLALVIAFGLFVVVPALASDIGQLVKHYPDVMASAQRGLYDPQNPLSRHLPLWAKNYIAHAPDQIVLSLRVHGLNTLSRALTVLATTVAAIAVLVVIPIVAAYLLLESENIKRVFVGAIPEPRREKSVQILSQLETVMGGFIRGQIIVGATVGILITIMLMIMHVRYAVLIGVMAGVLDVIPYVGAVATFIPAVSIAFFDNGWLNAAIVGGAFILIFEAEGHFIAPNIVSRSVSLSPLSVIVAILIGGELLGILGMFIAVPVAGMLRVLAMNVLPPKASIEEAKPGLTEGPREEVEPVGEVSA